MTDTDTRLRCPNCGRTVSRPLPGFAMYAECECGLVCHLGELDEEYDADYFQTEDVAKGHRNFNTAAAEHYDRQRFGEELSLLRALVAHRRVLDVGAATGNFLVVAQEDGWDAVGAEPSAGARAIAAERGAVVYASIDEAAGTGAFDVVTLHHVLEHTPDPVESLREVAKTVRPNGLVLVEVPNWASTERRACGMDWVDLRPTQHRWHFTPDTLLEVGTQAGLQPVQITTLGEQIPTVGSLLLSWQLPRSVLWRLRPGGDAPAEGDAAADADPPPEPAGWLRALASATDRTLARFRLGKRLRIVFVTAA